METLNALLKQGGANARLLAGRSAVSRSIELVAGMYLIGYTAWMYQVQQTNFFAGEKSRVKARA